MKTQKTFFTVILFMVAGFFAVAQNGSNLNVSELLVSGKLPQNLELKDEVQKYVVTTDHFNTDIFGNFFNKMRVKGEYTRGIEKGKEK